MRLKASVSSSTSRDERRGAAARLPGRARSTALIASTSRSIGSSRVAQQQRVEQDRARDGQAEHEQAVAARGVGEPVARDDRGDQGRDADEHGVDGEDLREEGAAAHLNGASRHRQNAARRLMG